MGTTNDTTTRMLERWHVRYADFAGELTPQARGAFERIRIVAHKHSAALNQRPDLDFERPLLLAVLIDLQLQVDDLKAKLSRRE